MPGTLFVVATPIGNLEDLTFRARRVLTEVDLIAAEDTRRTSKLLAHYEIRKPLVSLHEHNEFHESPKLVRRLASGESIALVSDAGTPGIADPGARLVRAAREANIPIVPIPGANAVATIMSVAGAEQTEFTFFGFPPAKGTARSEWFSRVAATGHTCVFFEAPHRITQTLLDCQSYLGKKQILVGKELTKLNELLVTKPINELIQRINPIGEFVIAAVEHESTNHRHQLDAMDQRKVLDLFDAIAASPLIPDDLAVELTALKLNLSLTDTRKAIKKAKILVKQQNT